MPMPISIASSAGRAPRAIRALEVLALDEFHDEEQAPLGLVDPVDRRDVRVVQARERPGLTAEARDPLAVVGEILGQDLERDVATEPCVVRAVDLAHSAPAEVGDDLVVGEGGADHGAAGRSARIVGGRAYAGGGVWSMGPVGRHVRGLERGVPRALFGSRTKSILRLSALHRAKDHVR